MLSTTNSPTGVSRRRMQHRRQLSTPTAFETPNVRQLPANQQQRRHNRTGMSLDLRGLNLESIHAHSPGPYQEHSTVSITNLGQSPQHTMQVAHSHSQPQPGPRETFLQSPVQISPRCSSPRTPQHMFRSQSPQQPPHSPNKPPTEQQLKELHEHIQSVYGSCGQVFINILPTPTATPQKPAQLPSHESFGVAPHPTNFADVADINLEPTPSAMTFDFENPDADLGYDSSSYYTSDVSPSPTTSPRLKLAQTYLEGIEEHPSQEINFAHPPTLLPALDPSISNGLPLSTSPFEQPMFTDLEIDASLEYTGIAPEEVQRYISEQDPKTNKWMCLYQDCGKVFGRRENIRSHVQTHLGDRQYKCNGCGKCFVRQHDLKRHAKIHTGNKPYKCPCGAGFARQDALTRHRQRGMCVGGFADAVRRQAKRGRPKKHRPDMEERVDKANRTRQALTSTASSVTASSPGSDMRSPTAYESYDMAQSQMLSDNGSFNDVSASTDPFSFETSSSPYAEETNDSSYAPTTSYAGEVASMNLLQQLSQDTNTPPLSPADVRPRSRESVRDRQQSFQSSPLKVSSSPSRSSVQSHQFTTPPTSPIEPNDQLEDLFDIPAETSCSQFDLEMKAMGDFTSMDSTSYDFLDFSV